MILRELAIYWCMLQGIPLHEDTVKPVAVKYELAIPMPRWYYDTADLQRMATKGLALPNLATGLSLPPLEFCRDQFAFNRIHARWVGAQLEANLDRLAGWKAWQRENDLLGKFWEAARDSQHSYYAILYRRECIKTAKDLLEPIDWSLGQWPDAVPLWRFIDVE